MKTLSRSALFLSASLAACGGGGADNVQPPQIPSSVLDQAVANYAATMPKITPSPATIPTPTYTGANISYAGTLMGFVPGTSDDDVLRKLAQIIINDPVKYQPLYELLLSDTGLVLTVKSEAYLPKNYSIKLTNGGVVIRQVVS